MRRIGLRASDLDPIGRGYLDLYVRASAKVELLDAYFAEHGLLKASGEPQGGARLYIAAVNSARHALTKLEAHLRDRTTDPVRELNEYLEANYVDDDGDGDSAA